MAVIRADAKRQRNQRNRCKSGTFPKESQSEPNIPPKFGHGTHRCIYDDEFIWLKAHDFESANEIAAIGLQS